MALKDKIFAAEDIRTEPMEVPEWGVTLHLAPLSGDQRNQYELAYSDNCDENGRLRSTSALEITGLILGCRDEDGQSVFSEKDGAALGKKNSQVITRVFDRIAEISGLVRGTEADDPKNADGESGGNSSDDSLLLSGE